MGAAAGIAAAGVGAVGNIVAGNKAAKAQKQAAALSEKRYKHAATCNRIWIRAGRA